MNHRSRYIESNGNIHSTYLLSKDNTKYNYLFIYCFDIDK